ncbi:MAG: alpha/beta hydrolase [Planctomycetota bacterium]
MTVPASSIEAAASAVELLGRSGKPVTAKVNRFGQGTRVCFLHGLVGLNEHWELAARSISDRADCILFQLPLLQLKGTDCSIDGVVDLTAKYLREHLDGPTVLVGNSFGGHVAVRLAIEAPEAVSGLILAGSSGVIEKTLVREVQLRPSRNWLAERLNELFYDDSYVRDQDLDRAHEELSHRSGARAMIKLSRSARKDHVGARLGMVQCPALLVWGRQDVVTPPEAAEQFHAALPNSKLVWFDDCGHVPMMEKSEEFSAEMRRFLDTIDHAASEEP